jgi:hypothetical protein
VNRSWGKLFNKEKQRQTACGKTAITSNMNIEIYTCPAAGSQGDLSVIAKHTILE